MESAAINVFFMLAPEGFSLRASQRTYAKSEKKDTLAVPRERAPRHK